MKIAIVTGARRGIGLGITRLLAGNGYRVVMCAASPAEAAEETVSALLAEGLEVEYVSCDVSKDEDRRALIKGTAEKYGRIDVLVNNAGVAPKVRMDILETTEESVQRLLDVNLKGTFFLCQLAAREMIAGLSAKLEDYSPRIVNVGSISAYTSSTSRGEYCMSKAGVGMVTLLFADRLAEYGIPVFEVRPGIIRTDMTAAVTEKYEKLIAEGVTPIRRFGQPEDVAKCVLAACSGLLDFGTGTVLNADGGFHIRRL